MVFLAVARLRAAVFLAAPAFFRVVAVVCFRARAAAVRLGAEADDMVLLALADETDAPPADAPVVADPAAFLAPASPPDLPAAAPSGIPAEVADARVLN